MKSAAIAVIEIDETDIADWQNFLKTPAERENEKSQPDRAGPSTARIAVEDEVERAIEVSFDDLYQELLKRNGVQEPQ